MPLLKCSCPNIPTFFLLSLPFPTLLLLLASHSYLSPPTLTTQSFRPSPNLAVYTQTHPETCSQWISAQLTAHAYLDAFIIGAQKGGTSELTKRLHDLGVRRHGLGMLKEWHFLYKVDQHGIYQPTKPLNETYLSFTSDDIPTLRLRHFLSGHPDLTTTPEPKNPPLIDDSPIPQRQITYDSTVEHLHSERTAFLANLLAPQARILVLLRDPIERAISQYNMLVRTINEVGNFTPPDLHQPNPAEFHSFVKREVMALRQCGYDADFAWYPGNTSELQDCVIRKANHHHLYIFRGLYSLHIEAWRRYFPAHRFLFIHFSDILSEPAHMLHQVTRFLCVREFPEDLLQRYGERGRNVSFGQATSLYGMEGVQDQFGGKGETRYMVEIWGKTRQMMEEVLRGSERKLEWMLGES